MNIVFWFLVILAGVVVWFCCATIFPKIGSQFKNLLNNTKRNIEFDEEDVDNESR